MLISVVDYMTLFTEDKKGLCTVRTLYIP